MSKGPVSPNSPTGPDQYESLGWLFTRLYWSGFGPLIALLVLIGTVQERGWLVPRDLFYAAVVLLIPLVRWLEFRAGKSRSAEGEPVTAVVLYKHAMAVVVIGLVAWIGAKLVGNFIIQG